FEFLERFAQVVNLRFLGFVDERIIAALRLIRRSEIAGKRSLGVMEVPSPRMDEASGFCHVLLLPLAAKEIIGFDFQKTLENERKGLGGGLLAGEHLAVIVVQAQEPSVAFEMGF